MKDIEKKAAELKRKVGENVRQARKDAGFSNADSAAADLEVSSTTLYELERGENWLSPELAVRMDEKWKVKIGKLFDGENIANSEQIILPFVQNLTDRLDKAIKDSTERAIKQLSPSVNRSKEASEIIERFLVLTDDELENLRGPIEIIERNRKQKVIDKDLRSR